MNGRHTVAVVGGGISGLAVAWWLDRAGLDVTLLEKEQAVGGTMKTIHEDGWLIETGPNSALETSPLFAEMFGGLGITDERLYADDRADKRYILRGGRLHALPMSPGAFLKSDLWTLGGKLRLLKEPFIGRATEEESVASFVERRLGREFLDYAINPFVAGVFAGDPSRLSVRSAFPKLYALEKNYGGLVKGMIQGRRERKRRAEVAKDRARMFSFTRGMESFPAAIGTRLGSRITTGAHVHLVEQNGSSWRVRWRRDGGEDSLEADSVVLSIPARFAASLIAPFAPDAGALLRDVYYPPVAEVFLGFREGVFAQPLDGFGYLIPEKERRNILGTIWSSSLFPERAPAGHVALTSFVGGSRQPELAMLPEKELVVMATQEVNAILGGTALPVFTRVIRWDHAIPQYALGYHRLSEALDVCAHDHPGLFFCNNYRGGISVGDCIISAKSTAEEIINKVDNPQAHVLQEH